MATYSYQEVTEYSTGTGAFSRIVDGTTGVHPSAAITDGNVSDDFFSSTDSFIFLPDGSAIVPMPGWTFIGYAEIGGQQYPVIDYGVGVTTIFGIALDSTTYPDIVSLNVQSTAFLTCFASGTRIATPKGDVTVETLTTGDTVETAAGRPVRVKWIGRQTVSTRFGPAERLMPVRFAAGSLGDGLPHTDLTVTADHGMLVDGVICHAGALVNGTAITRVPLSEMGESFTVYHIETEAHEIILANGAPAETFIDNVSRRVFDNFAEFEALYGDVPEMEELPYPRAMSARQVPAVIRRKLGTSDAA